MILGIEIGGTKLQFGLLDPSAPATNAPDAPLPHPVWTYHQALSVHRADGAAGILAQINDQVEVLQKQWKLSAVGIGFGGPLNARQGVITTSHQVAGWTDFPLADWFQGRFGLRPALLNDCDAAALGEDVFGAGREASRTMYVTVGTGVGGGLIVNGVVDGASRPAMMEIGHVQIGPNGGTVEDMVSGLGLSARALALAQAVTADSPHRSSAQQVLDAHAAALLDGKWLAARAIDHCPIAQETIRTGVEALGWALASAATLVAPEVIVVGGGIASMPDPLFWPPLRRAFETNVFAPLKGHVRLSATALGADSVVFGAVEAARRSNV